ncbi:hypothetical protein KSP35_08700 [Aquihabitans sp. G128]|uniref:hypothetical protein n=1 Tax=Aquihabitans sp. G128 TaxID=2849779 RepID=UPI001C238E78|nr:hypothetical protein [Aquihabitans sp. G128]QXC62841.1 hypothetical protein KSP35_08700 [Aquihabitans sp. G128]
MPVPAPDLAALRLLGDRVRPLAGAGERTLPVPEALAALLPQGGLVRGTTTATTGVAATSLALALAGPVTAAGSWVAVVGLPRLGLLAASELGVDLERVLLVAEPEPDGWAATVAALLDAVEVVLVRPPRAVTPTVQRRLQARARDRGSVVLQVGGHLGAWAQAPDLVVAAAASAWVGLEPGHGRLQARRVLVEVTGRRGADRPRQGELWLPGPDGAIATVAPSAAPAARPAAAAPPAEIALRDAG